ncbi:hypothetical protein Nepgr_025082 [Nepenthes gracilis]|uniref:Uncharacterized protein n=1 Tax=Nepenthes gracilis TaxID=150966 RepID=A0AAD3T693_NEPGR|nr:hypothetical protein Nepgr_025082 [Nepenthes gracilis]
MELWGKATSRCVVGVGSLLFDKEGEERSALLFSSHPLQPLSSSIFFTGFLCFTLSPFLFVEQGANNLFFQRSTLSGLLFF